MAFLPYPNLLPPPWGGRTDLQAWLHAPSCLALFPGAQAGCFPSSSSSSCALSVGLRQCRAPQGGPSPLPAWVPAPEHQAVSNLDTMHLAPSDHSRLFDGANDLELGAPDLPQTEINPASVQTKEASDPASDPPPPGYTGRRRLWEMM